MHFGRDSVWSAGLISFCIPTKARAMGAATMPLVSGLQVWVLLPDDLGMVDAVGAV